MAEDSPCLQERYAPENCCFGCGPANEKGLRLRSFVGSGQDLVCEWQPLEHHRAFGNILNGGIIGTLLDCHSNWTAAYFFMCRDGLDSPPCTVTADFHVGLRRPTPLDRPVLLSARAESSRGSSVVVHAELRSGELLTATCKGTFVAVGPGHPAYHRW